MVIGRHRRGLTCADTFSIVRFLHLVMMMPFCVSVPKRAPSIFSVRQPFAFDGRFAVLLIPDVNAVAVDLNTGRLAPGDCCAGKPDRRHSPFTDEELYLGVISGNRRGVDEQTLSFPQRHISPNIRRNESCTDFH
jgi:hypothetical protein